MHVIAAKPSRSRSAFAGNFKEYQQKVADQRPCAGGNAVEGRGLRIVSGRTEST